MNENITKLGKLLQKGHTIANFISDIPKQTITVNLVTKEDELVHKEYKFTTRSEYLQFYNFVRTRYYIGD